MFTDNTLRKIDTIQRSESPIAVSGINHKSSPVALREKFAVSGETQEQLLDTLVDNEIVREAVVLSTCNRVELVATLGTDQQHVFENHVEGVFETFSGVPRQGFSESLYHLHHRDAVGHLFRVAAGLDSMIVGEPQVLGQMKKAFSVAKDFGTTQAMLNRLFQRAFGVAKEVRTNTKIGHCAVSVCYAAKELAGQIFGELNEASVMLIGAGDTGALAIKHFRAAGVEQFYVANKTLARAADLAATVSGVALDLNSVERFLPKADIIIGASTLEQDSATLVNAAQVQAAMKERMFEPQFFIDLGVPRNFDSAIAELSDSYLYGVDDLQEVIDANIDARTAEVQSAQVIVDEEVEKFFHWLNSRSLEPEIRELIERCDFFQSVEVEKTLRRLRREGFSDEQLATLIPVLHDFSGALLSKTLHQPISILKQLGSIDASLLSSFKRLFFNR